MKGSFKFMTFAFKTLVAAIAGLLIVVAGCTPPTPTPSSESTHSAGSPYAEESMNDEVAGTDGKVLRHAVFFKFEEDSTEDDIDGVVQAFADLPEKIPAISEFEWGINDSPEGLDDGFTHCFLLSFPSEDARADYLPHEAHKAFGKVLGPHMDDVFVIDYWGNEEVARSVDRLRHAVFFKFKDDADPAGVRAVEQAFAALPSKIETIRDFEWGTNNSPESHDDGFTHCFLVTFDSDEDRQAYLPHPDHLAFVEVLKPVLDKVRVLDF